MDYLRQHNLASVPALLVISRHLATRQDGEDEATLRRTLQPAAVTKREVGGSRNDALLASLEVGTDITLLEAHGARKERRWSLSDQFRAEVVAIPPADSRPFAGLVLRLLCARAKNALETGESPSDVARALTWLLQRDPFVPLPNLWSEGPEDAVREAGLDAVIENPEQWRALVRWARSLGLATVITATGQKQYLIPDPTKGLSNNLDRLPPRAPADQWFRQLWSLLPVLGHPELVSALPQANAPATEVANAVALAMTKLERAGRVQLVAADDARSAVVLRLGQQVSQVGEVRIVEEVA